MLKSSTMKPNFTLSLSFDGIRLLHRTAGGWRLVGEVALDSADLAAELAVLRKTATALDSGGLRSLLLIPDAQIKYLTTDTPGMDQPARRVAAAAALEGATPYAVADLVYDVSADGGQTHVAAVARETLDEAEAFAVEHRFHPVSFAAAPAAHAFAGAPHFGVTKSASKLLDPGETVEPEAEPIVITGALSVPEGPIADLSEAPTADKPSAEPALAATPNDTPPPVEEDLPALATPEKTPDASVPAALKATPAETPPPLDEGLPTLDAPVADPTTPDAAPEAELAPTPKTSPPPLEEDLPELDAGPAAKGPREASEQATPPISGSVAASAAPLAAAAGVEAATPPATTPPATTPSEPSRKVDFSAPPSRSAPAAGFASRSGASDTAPNLGGASRATPPPPPAAKPEPTAAPAPALSTPSLPIGAPSPAAAPLAPQMAPATAAATTVAATPQPDSSSLTPDTPPSVGAFLSRRKPKPTKDRRSAATPAAATATSEADRMTVFGARRRNEVGGKPRFLGLILTAALLVFLAGVAAWASIFLDDGNALSRLFGDRSPRSTAEALAPADTPTTEDEIAVLPPDEPAEPDAIETAALDAGLTDEDGAVLDALRDPEPQPSTEMTEAEVDAKYATTGIWARAPDVPPAPAAAIDIDDLYLTSIDPISTTTDAVALPPAAGFGTDTAPGAVNSPVAAGTRFALDARGLVAPTVQGALSPDGHLVYLGRPPVQPPATLTRPEVEPVAPEVDNTLEEARPRTRPEDLEETTERAQLDGLTRSELAGLRPQLRPQSVQEKAEETLAAAAAPEVTIDPIDTSDAVAAALAAPPAIQNATEQATTQSRRPDTRPRNFDRIVKRAARSPEPAQVASVAPKAVQPRFPSKTSVAQQATVKNAINLRDVNLIGVYGKPSNRRALVRLSNGRYQKVEVGDRIDGGRVSAIGDSELRYVRRGRDVVLKMPN